MKVSLSFLPAFVGAALAAQDATATQPDLLSLTTKFETLTSSFLARALERLDERDQCARAKGEERSCTRENVVLRKE
jgi:hypothetical protein